jgi:hypothetical protein
MKITGLFLKIPKTVRIVGISCISSILFLTAVLLAIIYRGPIDPILALLIVIVAFIIGKDLNLKIVLYLMKKWPD